MLFGREREEHFLDHALDEARGGRSTVAALVGDAGIGKSALLAYAESRATGMQILRARGIQSEARIPFSALFELLRPALGRIPELSSPQREALEGALALRPGRAKDRFAVGAATLGLLAAHAEESPLLVLIDDAQWIDGSSADALLFAFRRLIADPIAVVLTVRRGDASFIDDADIAVHTVNGLDRDAVAMLAAQHGRREALTDLVIDRLHQGTAGNPLALIELADEGTALTAGLPLDAPLPIGTRVASRYLERFDRLPAATRDVMLLAATSDSGDVTLLAKAAAHAAIDIADLQSGESSGLVRLVSDRLEFRHPLVRSAIYAHAVPSRRRDMHRALATALPDSEADRRAWHLALAALGPNETACSAMEQAARRAIARSAYDVASHAFERAAALAMDDRRRTVLTYEAADSAWLAGLATRTVALLDAVVGQPAPVEVTVAIEHLRGHVATRRGPIHEALAILLAGATIAAEIDVEQSTIMLAEAVNAAFYAADTGAMRSAAQRISMLPVGTFTGRSEFFAAIAKGMALIFEGESPDEGAQLVRHAVALVDASDEFADDPRLLAWAAMGPMWLREADAGRSLIQRAQDAVHGEYAVGVLPFLLSHVAADQATTDRWPEAEAGFHKAIALARETGQQTDLAFALARLASLEARQGREEDCRTHVAEARQLARDVGLGLIEIWALSALGDLAFGSGRVDEAVACFHELQATLVDLNVNDADLSPEPELVELELRRGRRDVAAAHAEAFEQKADRKGQPWSRARAARCRGLTAPDDAIDDAFAEALECHSRTPDGFERARTQLAYGTRLRRARQRTRAREQLRPALETFEHLGARGWADVALAELRATGESARRRDVSTHDQLTPQELQVALALGAGKTTREAAATLFVSPKTVEYHLRNVYRKLMISSRDELAAAMSFHSGPPSG